jgi:hypothetical protein
MDTEIEDLLREGMERFTADLRAPAGLTRRLERRRRRRLALRSATAAAVLTAAAVALVAVLLPGAFLGGSTGSAASAAYVVKKVDNALSAAEPGEMAQMTVTTTSPVLHGEASTVKAEEWSYDGRWRSVVYSPDGQPAYDEGLTRSSSYTVVSYPTRTWGRQQVLSFPAAPTPKSQGCGPAFTDLPMLFREELPDTGLSVTSPPATVAASVRTAISCGALAEDGRQLVNGISAIKLTSRTSSPLSETIWIDPSTYLPVRVVTRSPGGMPAIQQTANIAWLRPTARNLAQLSVTIPAGFREVSLFDAALRVLQSLPLPMVVMVKSAVLLSGNGEVW